MSHLQLDFESLCEEIAQVFTPESGDWTERLLHTYVANPVAALFTQVQIIQKTLERKPEMLPEEIASLRVQVKAASDNVVMIVKALRAAFPDPE